VARILVVEDDPAVSEFLLRALSSKGWAAEALGDAELTADTILWGDYALVLLSLPFRTIDGESLLRQVMAIRPEQKIIVSSSAIGADRPVDYLQAGATDFLSKPFSVDELVARVQARLRVRCPSQPEAERHLRRRGVTLDLWRRKANAGKGEVALTEREFVLLAHLMTHDGAVFTRDELLSELWGPQAESGSNLVECYVARLRAKLGEDLIETVWKRGYAFVGLYADFEVQAAR
jgi:DNA-binding response OmpR family regulator